MKIFKRIKWSYVVLSVMFLLLGIYLVVNPETSLIMICRILGAAMAVFGVMKIVLYFIREVEGVAIRFDFAVGLFCIILGVLMLWRAPALTDILSVMIGLLVLVDSVFKLQVAVDSRRMGAHSWWVTLVCTVVCLVLGILLVFNPFDGKQVLTIMMGVSLIVDGVQNLCTVVYAAVFVKDVKNAVHDFVDNATAIETTGEVIGENGARVQARRRAESAVRRQILLNFAGHGEILRVRLFTFPVLWCKKDRKMYANRRSKGELPMLEQNFQSVYEKFKLQFFRRLFSQVREREGSLSAMEAFSVEVIHELDAPTIGQFADFLGISQSNATYKVNNLIRKGYIVKENSDTDRREYHLKLSDKFYCYNGLMQSYIDTVMARIHERFTPEELATFEHVLAVMSDELMPECDVPEK